MAARGQRRSRRYLLTIVVPLVLIMLIVGFGPTSMFTPAAIQDYRKKSDTRDVGEEETTSTTSTSSRTTTTSSTSSTRKPAKQQEQLGWTLDEKTKTEMIKMEKAISDNAATVKHLLGDDQLQEAAHACRNLIKWPIAPQKDCLKKDPYGKSCLSPSVAEAIAAGKCLIYSVGIADWYEFDKYYGRQGCEVHSFDPTVKFNKSLGPGVTFHNWGMRGSNQASLSDEAVKSKEFLVSIHVEKMGKITGDMFTLPEIRKKLGHEDRQITVLKLDCEGCEWGVMEDMVSEFEEHGVYVDGVAMEWHFQKGLGIDSRQDFLRVKTVSDLMDKYYVPGRYFKTGTHPRDANIVDELKLCLPRPNYIAEMAYTRK